MKVGCVDVVFIFGFNIDGVEVDVINWILIGDLVYYCGDWDVGVFVLVVVEYGIFGGYYIDYFEVLIVDVYLLVNC